MTTLRSNIALVLAGLIAASGVYATEDMQKTRHYPDHFVVGISDLETGMNRIEALTGVRPAMGGTHPHIGTHNALISLGEDSYLEIIAPDPAAKMDQLDPAMKAQFRDPLETMDELTPFLWAVGSTGLDTTIERLAQQGIELSAPQPGARRKPDGSMLEWRASFVAQPRIPGLPFFIEWLKPEIAPPKDSPPGCSLAAYAVSGPAKDALESIRSSLGLEFELSEATSPGLSVQLNCPKGHVTL